MNIIAKLGGVPKVYEILKEYGWNYSLPALRMQISRGSLSRDVCLILTDFMNARQIAYTANDFYLTKEKGKNE